ncbi:MAG: NADH-quinone oxidoreductase subunit NuoE [Candidatus Cloacimonas sp.]|jgi:NADH-quinone oxidoreductase subunit E|nr:NADH-quinone oxidoreductase subunit NuoE [Candidatus Cloacimonadota bacterium]
MDLRKQLERIIFKYEFVNGSLIPMLQEIQELEGYLSKETMKMVSDISGIGVADIFGVATFYTVFRLKPQGKHTIRICKGTACHVSNADLILTTLRNELDLEEGEDTTADNKFTLFEVACLGCCSLAPVIMIDNTTYGKLDPQKISEILASY